MLKLLAAPGLHLTSSFNSRNPSKSLKWPHWLHLQPEAWHGALTGKV